MDVYVDESGDLGFKAKATRYFIVAFITCDSSFNIRKEMNRTLKKLHCKGKYPYAYNELKFCRMDDFCRKIVLQKIDTTDSYKGVIVVEKSRIDSKLRNDPVKLYNYLVVHNVMSALFPFLLTKRKMHLVMDKSLCKSRIEAFNDYVKNKASYMSYTNGADLPFDCVSADHLDSVREPCLQVVDSIAGAYFQAYEKNDPTYENILKNYINYFNKLWQ